MNLRAHEAYATTQMQTSVASASPIDLVVMVYDRIFEHLKSAESALQAGRSADEFIAKALELISVGLQSCLIREQGCEIADNLSALYDWANRKILIGKLKKDPTVWIEVRQVLYPLAEAWRTLAEERRESAVTQIVAAQGGA